MSDFALHVENATQYAFYYENAHLLLTLWERDNHRDVHLIREQRGSEMVLDYPGDLFVERIMDVVDRVFFISVTEADREGKYALGCALDVDGRIFGMYYPRESDAARPELVVFEIINEGDVLRLEEIDAPTHQRVAREFSDLYGDQLDIGMSS